MFFKGFLGFLVLFLAFQNTFGHKGLPGYLQAGLKGNEQGGLVF